VTGCDFDLVVIGAGSGGVRAARVAAELGARVAIVESGKFGGTCVNLGCVPKKLLVHGAEFAHELADARGFGWTTAAPSFDWPTLIARKDAEIARLNGIYLGLLESAGVEIVRGHARIVAARAVRAGSRTLSCEHVLLATGSAPSVPALPGSEYAITSDQAFHLPAVPERVTIVGGGYIAVEFAGIFHGFGAQVAIVSRGEQLLSAFDRELGQHLARELSKQGIAIRCRTTALAIERRGGELHTGLDDGSALESDLVLLATGRRANTHGLGLEQIGVQIDVDGAVQVDAYSRSSVANVFAVGDCAGGPGLTPVAIADGQAASQTMFGSRPTPAADRDKIPTAVFSQPPVAARARWASVRAEAHAAAA
jgi:glutathione reductase (NADPH)